jgi:hypothetical protein
VQAGWAFPQANVSFCRGPKVGKSTTAKMKRLYPAAAFDKNRVTVVLKGTSTSRSGSATLVYRWKATVTLARS